MSARIKMLTALRNRLFLTVTGLVFFILVAVLLYSYIFKLGYMGIAEISLFYGVPIIAFINIFRKKRYPAMFWVYMTLFFVFIAADKHFRIHVILSRVLSGVVSIDPMWAVNFIYVFGFSLGMIFFVPYILKERRSDWIILFGIALTMKAIAFLTDYLFHDITEDYFELFAMYFFAASFINAFVTQNNYIISIFKSKGEKP